jgi:hypothetical protein
MHAVVATFTNASGLGETRLQRCPSAQLLAVLGSQQKLVARSLVMRVNNPVHRSGVPSTTLLQLSVIVPFSTVNVQSSVATPPSPSVDVCMTRAVLPTTVPRTMPPDRM